MELALGASTPLDVIRQSSRNLTDWQPAPPAVVTGRNGKPALFNLCLTRDDPRFVRLIVRRAR